MNKNIKMRWVKALRSGLYEQGQSKLRREKRSCCLGVLCAVMGAKWNNRWGADYPLIRGKEVSDGGTVLLPSLLKMIGMKKTTQDRLVEMNDYGKSFVEIAQYIEKRL